MPETTRGLLLGILYVLEFLEFLTSPQGLVASLWLSLYSFVQLTFPSSLAVAITVSGLFAIVTFWILAEPQG